MLILGGGFGGLYAALHLDKTIAAEPDVEVTLVNRENFVLFTPMLHEVAAGELDLSDIVSPLRQMLRHVNFLEADVEDINLEERHVTVAYGIHRSQKALHFDHLVIALGSETNFFNLPGVEERAATMKSLSDAFVLRNQVLALLEVASMVKDPAVRRDLLTFVVAGGGFAGTETIGALNDYVREAIRYYPGLSESEIRFVLVHPNEVILPELGEKLGRYAQRKLAARKVDILTSTRVSAYSGRGVELNNGKIIPARTLVWTAGVTPPAVLRSLPCRQIRNRIVVDETLEVPEHPGVWAVGDCAWIPNAQTGKPHPPTAQHALREAVHCAKNIVAAIRGRRKKPFVFTTIGQLATIGRRCGVARILGVNLSGLFAWWLWRTIYLAKLPRFEKKVRVALHWTMDLFFPKDYVQHLTLHTVERVYRRLSRAQRYPLVTVPTRLNKSSQTANDWNHRQRTPPEPLHTMHEQ